MFRTSFLGAGLVLSLTLAPTLSPGVEWTVSADLRERYQSFSNGDFDARTNDAHSEFDSRLYLKARGELGQGWSLYLQPQAVAIQDRRTGLGSSQLSQADLLQAYVQYGDGALRLRLGRQQLVYGDQRLLGHLGWKDVARTFDGIKGIYETKRLRLDLFAVHPADIVSMTPTPASPHGLSLVSWEDRSLLGGYATYRWTKSDGVDVYFINWRHGARALAGAGRNLNTFGTRAFLRRDGADLTLEATWQNGQWSNGVRQRAAAYALRAGYTFAFWRTRLGVEYDVSPGDAKTDPRWHKNFVFPFHTNHMHYGEMDFFSWANMHDLRLSLRSTPRPRWTLKADLHVFRLDQARGDWLNVVGTGVLFAGAPNYTQTDAGREVDIKLIHTPPVLRGLKLVAMIGSFLPGAAVAERNGGRADRARFGYLFAHYAF